MAKLRVREVAESKQVTQTQIIERSGVTPQLLHRYWHNYTGSVSLEQIEKIAKALGVRSGELIEDTDVG